MSHGTAVFFGVLPSKPPATELATPDLVFVSEEKEKLHAEWAARRLRHYSRQYGHVQELLIGRCVPTSTDG
jgi:hypothetical protein